MINKTRYIQKALACIEDILVGAGAVTQTRNGTDYILNKINADNLPYSGDSETGNFISIKEMFDLHITDFIAAKVIIDLHTAELLSIDITLSMLTGTTFDYIEGPTPSATEADEWWLDTDSGKVYKSIGSGTGNWVLQYQNIIQNTFDDVVINADIDSSGIITTDTIDEHTSDAGVTIEGVELKDGIITTDTIDEHTSDAGVTIEGIEIKDGLVEGVEIKDGLVEGVNIKLYSSFPVYKIDQKWQQKGSGVAVDRRTIQSPNCLEVNINGALYQIISQQDYDLNTSDNWDSVETSYAANRAGKDFYIYACEPASGNIAVIVLSANSTYPGDYTADTSRKIGGFHCLCVDAGTISGHDLTGYLRGDILPLSVWDLLYRSDSGNEGMVWHEQIGKWVDIYLQSGTESNTASVFEGTITEARTWMDHVEDLYTVNKFLLDDSEFQSIAAGSNEETSVDEYYEETTGGHIDTVSRRMISNIGCESCCGVRWQWLRDQGYRGDGTLTYSWKNETGGKGRLYTQGAYGDVKLLAGGAEFVDANCGSRARYMSDTRWSAAIDIGARGCSKPRIVHL